MMHRHRSADTAGVPAWVNSLASRRLTVLFFLLTAGASIAIMKWQMPATQLVLVPLALLAVNICAAIFASARFRADLPLLVFHLCLVALVMLVGVARLTYMEGKATLTSGTEFDGTMESEESGILHTKTLRELRFANEGFTEAYFRKGKHRATYNQVRWQDDNGKWHLAEIGDDQPLLLRGYRIYTTSRRGFSPVFLWEPDIGEGEIGTVQLNDQAPTTLGPSMTWNLPGGTPARATLNVQGGADGKRDDMVNLGTAALPHTMTVKIHGNVYEMKPGQTVELLEGQLTYVRLDSWMGYLIKYDPTQPWIMATVLIGIASLIWFYWRRIW